MDEQQRKRNMPNQPPNLKDGPPQAQPLHEPPTPQREPVPPQPSRPRQDPAPQNDGIMKPARGPQGLPQHITRAGDKALGDVGTDVSQPSEEIDSSRFNELLADYFGNKKEPVRVSSAIGALAMFLVVLLNSAGYTSFTINEATVIVGGVFVLANEIARMKVFAPYRRQ